MTKIVALHEKIEGVRSKSDLAEFIKAIANDLKENPDKWENPTLDLYLSAMSEWVESMDNYYKNTNQQVPQAPSWKTFAEILYAARIYE